MKKILSVFFVMIFALSFVTAAFAQSGEITLDETVSVTLEKDDEMSFSFTAQETAVYRLSFVLKNKSYTECKIYSPKSTDYKNAGALWMYYSDEDEKSVAPSTYVCINKGTKISVVLTEASGKHSYETDMYDLTDTAELEMTLAKSKLGPMEPGKIYRTTSFYAGHYFIPEKSGYYNIRSFSTSTEYDPSIRIYDEDGLLIQDDDMGYNGDLNYDTTVYFTAGSVYFINPRVSVYDEENDEYDYSPEIPIDYTYSLTDASGMKVESYQLGSDNIVMTSKNYYVNPVYIIPGGAASSINAEDVSVVSSKPSVADVYSVEIKDGAVCISIYAKKAGSAVFTVELPDGEGMEFNVKVRSKLIVFFENLFNTITSKIKGLFNR